MILISNLLQRFPLKSGHEGPYNTLVIWGLRGSRTLAIWGPFSDLGPLCTSYLKDNNVHIGPVVSDSESKFRSFLSA